MDAARRRQYCCGERATSDPSAAGSNDLPVTSILLPEVWSQRCTLNFECLCTGSDATGAEASDTALPYRFNHSVEIPDATARCQDSGGKSTSLLAAVPHGR